MKVTSIFCGGKSLFDKNDEESKLLAKCMCFCNNARKSKGRFVGDPTETALLDYAKIYGFEGDRLFGKRVCEIPFSSDRKMMSVVVEKDGKKQMWTKGAVDRVLQKCSHIQVSGKIREISAQDRTLILQNNKVFGEKKERVLAFAFEPSAV